MQETKKGKVSRITIIVLIIVILGLIGYILYDKNVFNLKENNTKTEEKSQKKETKIEEESTEVSEEMKAALIKRYKMDSNGSFQFLSDVYFPTKINSVENMKGSYFAAMTSNLASIKTTKVKKGPQGETIQVATKEEYNRAFKEVFGPDVEVDGTDTADNERMCNYVYNASDDTYEAADGCGGFSPVASYVKEAKSKKNTIVIDMKYYSIDTTKAISSLKNKSFSKAPVEDANDPEEVKNKYDQYLETYRFTFKKASDSNYYFYSVENKNDAKEYK